MKIRPKIKTAIVTTNVTSHLSKARQLECRFVQEIKALTGTQYLLICLWIYLY
jgi:hypothetical protein